MKLYGISGLGADERVFQFLKLDYELVPVKWIAVNPNESIESYTKRLSEVIDTNSDLGLIGVSFGGLIATEINKRLNPKLTVLISSAATKNDISWFYRLIGKTGLLKRIPPKLFAPPEKLAYWFFGAKKKSLLKRILEDTDLKFAKWAVNELLNWKNEETMKNTIKIHGTKDKLIRPHADKNTIWIKGGEHFMIVDRADEISKIINQELNKIN